MGMFKKRKSSSDSVSYDGQNSPERSTASAPTVNGSRKKKGLGSKLKNLVPGRKSFSGSVSLNSRDSKEDSDSRIVAPPQVKRMPQKEESSYSSYSSEEDHFHNPLGTVAEVNEDDYDSDGELRVRPKQSSLSSSQPPPRRQITPARSQRLGGGTPEQFVEHITVVILLVDPQSKRFELLQLQQTHRPTHLKVKSVLKQCQKCITEPELKKLNFVALLDRQGNIHKPNTPLSKAMGFNASKDILVGLVQGMEPEQVLQTVRPIMGDTKMSKLLEMNGFDTKGWVTKKKTKDSILDKRPPSLVQEEKQGGALAVFFFTVVLAALLWGVDTLLTRLDAQGAFVQPLMDWPTVVESAGDVARQGVQAAKEAILEGNSTALQCLANSTFTMVEETALEAVSDTKAIVQELYPYVQNAPSPKVLLESAKDKFLMAALPMLSEARSNISSTLNATFSNTTKIINAASPNTPNSVWEDYVLIGLLVCWLLYWMAI